jgi:hypothetical protein
MGMYAAWVAAPALSAVAVPLISGGWLGVGVAAAVASILGIQTVRVCADARAGLVAVAAALAVVAEVVWLPRGGVEILLVAVVVWVLLPKASKLPMRLRNLLPAAILGTLTAGAAMYGPPPGLRPATLLVAIGAALAAMAWQRLRLRPYR